jgi:heme/copper-type cytochrome/quinol oxidase subunit 1
MGIGVVLLLAGVVICLRTCLAVRTSVWVAYAPLSDAAYPTPGGLLMLRPGNWWGIAIGSVGALVVSSALGYAIGHRRPRTSGDQAPGGEDPHDG